MQVLEKFKRALNDVFRKVDEVDDRKFAAAALTYTELCLTLAEATHAGNDSGLPPEDIQRIRDEAGKSPDQLKDDVSVCLRRLANEDVAREADEHRAVMQQAQREKNRLEQTALPAALQAVKDVRAKIAEQDRIISRQGKLDIAAQRAKSENVTLCLDHRREASRDLNEQMHAVSDHLRRLREERDTLAGQLAEMESEAEKHNGDSLGDLANDIATIREELNGVVEEIDSYEIQWKEMKNEKRELYEEMTKA